MLRLNQELYAQRYREHIAKAKTLCAEHDYPQAGEKIWGALSALINSRVLIEQKSVNQKENSFVSLFHNFVGTSRINIRPQMHELELNGPEDIFHCIEGLHKFFYGGANFTDQWLSEIIPFLISLIEQL